LVVIITLVSFEIVILIVILISFLYTLYWLLGSHFRALVLFRSLRPSKRSDPLGISDSVFEFFGFKCVI